MTVFISKEYDSYVNIYADNNPNWIATLSNGDTVYQDDGRPEVEPESAWARLKIYCEENSLHITNIKVKNRSHLEDVGSDYDGYFFCKGVGAVMFGYFTLHTFNIVIIENGKLRVRTWRLPELIPERFEDRELEGSHEFIIAKEGVLDGQKLQASDDGSRM